MNTNQPLIRVGLIGAGQNTRDMHIPGFREIETVEIVCVANRTRESGERVASEFNIPAIKDSWIEVLKEPNLDAVCIGTWPNMHCEITCAALEAGKHVLCEARMARDLKEARQMLQTSRQKPGLVAQIVPSPLGLRVNATVKRLVRGGWLGQILAVNVRDNSGLFAETDLPIHWRQRRELSGFNTLSLGIWYETVMRWLGHSNWVQASARICVSERRDPETQESVLIRIPDHLNVLSEFENGACGSFQFSSVTGMHRKSGVQVFGTEGSLEYDLPADTLRGARKGDEDWSAIEIPPDEEERWRVEEEFINAIRGTEEVRLTDFETGVKYMEFVEAVYLSWTEGRRIHLPPG